MFLYIDVIVVSSQIFSLERLLIWYGLELGLSFTNGHLAIAKNEVPNKCTDSQNLTWLSHNPTLFIW